MAKSCLVSADIDPKDGGVESLRALIRDEKLPFPPTLVQLTGGGGAHIIFLLPEGDFEFPDGQSWPLFF